MSIAQLTISPPTLPIDYCFGSWQQVANDLVGEALVNFDTTGLTGVLNQNTIPLSTQRNFIWHNPDTSHVLVWNIGIGSWVARHQVPIGGGRQMYVGSLVDLVTYDGGDVNAIGDASGAMWEQDTLFNGRMPIGAGALPDVVNGVVTVAVNGTGGHNELAIAKANLPTDTVDVKTAIIGQIGVTGGTPLPVVGTTYGSDAIAGLQAAVDATNTSGGLASTYYTRGQTLPLGSGTALNMVSPFYGVYVIRRTNRLFYTT